MIPLQETFDTIVNHLRKQNKRAIVLDKFGEEAGCQYRTPEGLMCAAGCLIKDEDYTKDLEGYSIKDKSEKLYPVGRLLRDYGHDVPLVYELQTIHDRSIPSNWEDRFKEVAEKFNLVYKTV